MSSSRQVAVTRQDVQEAIDEAMRLWPWVRKDAQAVAAVASHWLLCRRETSQQEALADIQERLARIERRLGIEEEAE